MIVVLHLLKILTTLYSDVWSEVAVEGTGSNTTAENFDHCPYAGVRSGVAVEWH
jgi:hypothetical protein